MKIHREKCAATDLLSSKIYSRVKSAVPERLPDREYVSLKGYEHLVKKTKIDEQCYDDYSNAIQTALNKNVSVYIPCYDSPLYISEAIVLNSNNTLKVHEKTRIVFLKDGIMLHNRNVVVGHFSPVAPDASSDRNIAVIGGIWETPHAIMVNLRTKEDRYIGSDATFALSNIIGVRVEDVTFRELSRYGVQIGNCEGFIVQNIKFETARRDGIHLDGPASYGIIRNIEGKVGDDVVALNAWDWANSAITFGAIHDVIVEDINCEPGYLWSEMRILPGNKTLPFGQVIECPVYNICVRNVHGLHTFKLYQQPSLVEGYSGWDKSMGIGAIYNVFFENMTIDFFDAKNYYTVKNSAFEIHADAFNIGFKNINFNFPLRDKNYCDYCAVAVGPISHTWKRTENPDDWFDFFDPDSICKVKNISMEDIKINGEPCTDTDKLLMLRRQTLNLDYPKTTPAGGIGFGVLDELYVI